MPTARFLDMSPIDGEELDVPSLPPELVRPENLAAARQAADEGTPGPEHLLTRRYIRWVSVPPTFDGFGRLVNDAATIYVWERIARWMGLI